MNELLSQFITSYVIGLMAFVSWTLFTGFAVIYIIFLLIASIIYPTETLTSFQEGLALWRWMITFLAFFMAFLTIEGIKKTKISYYIRYALWLPRAFLKELAHRVFTGYQGRNWRNSNGKLLGPNITLEEYDKWFGNKLKDSQKGEKK